MEFRVKGRDSAAAISASASRACDARVPRERDDAMQLRIELFQTMQIDFRNRLEVIWRFSIQRKAERRWQRRCLVIRR